MSCVVLYAVICTLHVQLQRALFVTTLKPINEVSDLYLTLFSLFSLIYYNRLSRSVKETQGEVKVLVILLLIVLLVCLFFLVVCCYRCEISPDCLVPPSDSPSKQSCFPRWTLALLPVSVTTSGDPKLSFVTTANQYYRTTTIFKVHSSSLGMCFELTWYYIFCYVYVCS